MKKYIRTKDNELYKYVTDFDEYIIAAKNGIYSESIKKDNILDQADTIEELCDEFVMFCPNAARKKIRVYNTMSSISLYFKRDKRWNGNMVDKVYGAIWTDKGLIYVAKMNDKGELELI